MKMFYKTPKQKFYNSLCTINEIYVKTKEPKYYIPTCCDVYINQHKSPDIYNKYGEKVHVCFMSNEHPYEMSRNIYFDHYDWGLDVHFYGGLEMNRFIGKPRLRLGFIGESQAILPNDYRYVYDNKDYLSKELNYIYTFDERILNEYSNSKMFPYAAEPWFGRGKVIDEYLYEKKSKNISMIASNKTMTELQLLRIKTAKYCKNNNIADTYGNFDGGNRLLNYDEAFTEYRYAIVIENNVSDYYFTEKVTSCFASFTIPIYVGARKINEFFNSDGIIQISIKDLDSIDEVLKQCNENDYVSRKNALIDNFNRVKEYDDRWNWWYRHYGIILD